MAPREWSRAELQDLARGRLVRLFRRSGENVPLPPWLDEVIAGAGPFEAADTLETAHPQDHASLMQTYIERSRLPGTSHETRCRYRIDGAWWWTSIRVVNLLEQDGINAMLTAATVEGRADTADTADPELSDEHIGDHDSMSWMQVQLDHLGVVLHVEGKSVEIAGRRPDEMVGQSLTTFIHPDSAKDTIPMWFSLLGEGAGATRSSRRCYVHPDGTGIWVESAYLNRLEGDGGGHVLVFASDITERRAQEEALRLQTREVARLGAESRLLAEDFRLLADEVPAAVFRCDDEGRITFHNARWTELLDGGDGIVRLADIVAADQRAALTGHLNAVLSDEGSTPHAFELGAARDGRVYAFRCRSIADLEPTRRPIVGSIEDVTATVQLRLDASHDALTGLLNRAAIDLALAAALRDEVANLVVLFVDLDRFKDVNDGHGHEAGDIVLREIAARLASAVRPGDVVGRYGGDEFVVLCHSVEPARATALPRRLEQALEGPIQFPGGRWPASASVGAARPRPGDDLMSVMRRADQAMFEEKRRRDGARAAR